MGDPSSGPLDRCLPGGAAMHLSFDMESGSVSGGCVVGFSGRWLD
jgi:hypothetical protein